MLNQTYSSENFLRIIINENRKGNNIEKKFFDDIYRDFTLKVKECNVAIKKRRSEGLDKELFKRYYSYITFLKKQYTKNKEIELLSRLDGISNIIVKENFKITIESKVIKGKPTYMILNLPENYFAIKQLQKNFYDLYKVKQASRYEILSQSICLLNDRTPKYVIRTDIKSFYENMPDKVILRKLDEDNLLSPISKKFIRLIISEYKRLSGSIKGIPRGIGISAYLSEYYMKDVDNAIKNMEYISYYQRYVDDMILIFNPPENEFGKDYLTDLITLFKSKDIEHNVDKTLVLDLRRRENKAHEFEFLGYKFVVDNNSNFRKIKPVKILFSNNKILKYKDRIRQSFDYYAKLKYKGEKKAYRVLKSRIKFLTGNTRLANNKNNILIGSYFSNNFITDVNDFEVLDKFMNWKIDRFINKRSKRLILKAITFKIGFTTKKFHKVGSGDLKRIIEIWK